MMIDTPWNEKTLSTERARLYIVVTALGYSLMGVTLKFVSVNPFVFSGMEKAFCLLGLVVSRGSFRIRFNRKTLPGAVLMYSTSLLFVLANKLTTAANAVILQYTNPIFVILITRYLLHKKVEKRDVALSGVMLLGMVLFFVDDLSAGNMLGNVIAVVSGVTMALANMYAHYSGVDVREYGIINCLIAMAAGAVALPFTPMQFPVPSLLATVFYGIFCSAVPIIFLAKAAPYVEPVSISMILMIEPICGPILVALVFGEVPQRIALVGAVIVLLGVCANNLYPLFQKKRINANG